MVTTTPATTGTASSANSGSAISSTISATPDTQSIAGNFDEFLQLLTTQLQNQDPMNPMDSNSFTSELVQFASIEQQMNTNTSLSTLVSLQETQQTTSALAFLGATVAVGGNTAQLTNGQATWNYSVTSPATATINISNSSGQVVYTTTQAVQPGTQTFTWNGQDAQGNTWPAGAYTASISAVGANSQSVNVTTSVQGVVTAVNANQNPPTLTVGGQTYPLSQIAQILSQGSSNASTN